MSYEPKFYTWRRRLLRCRDVSLGAKGVGCLIRDALDDIFREDYITPASLAEEWGSTERKVLRWLEELEDAGWIVVDGENDKPLYLLTVPETVV